MEEVKGRGIPEWLSFDATSISGRIVSMPTREQINLPVQEQLIVELYSKKAGGPGRAGRTPTQRAAIRAEDWKIRVKHQRHVHRGWPRCQ